MACCQIMARLRDCGCRGFDDNRPCDRACKICRVRWSTSGVCANHYSVFNMFGSLVGGCFADQTTVRKSVIVFPALSVISLIIILFFGGGVVTLCGVALIGFTYGATIVTYPAAVSTLYGVVPGVRVYGQVFTAWGIAGLFAPWFAGVLFERSGNYKMALMTAAIVGVISVVIAGSLPAYRSILADDEEKIGKYKS